MRRRGLSIAKLGPFSTKKAMAAILIPTITYTIESMPVEFNDYKYIERVVDEMVSETLGIDPSPQWASYELGLIPATLIIQRNKIALYRKAMTESDTLLGIIVKAAPHNFLEREVQDIAEQWEIQHSLDTILRTKSKALRTEKIRDRMTSVSQRRITEQLTHTWWATGTTQEFAPQPLTGVFPASLALNMAPLREKFLLEEKSRKICRDCDKEYMNTIVHVLEECSAAQKNECKEELKIMVEKQPQKLQETLASLEKHDRVKVYLGLVGFETNLSDNCFQQVIKILTYLG
jgi:hypothetical protein